MADEHLKQKIYGILKYGCFRDSDDAVYVSDGDAAPDDIHVVIVSRKFDGRYMEENHDLIWAELTTRLAPEEWGKVSLSVGVGPEELKAI